MRRTRPLIALFVLGVSSAAYAKVMPPKPAATESAVADRPEATPTAKTRVRVEVAAVLDTETGPVVLLRDVAETRVLPIWIGPAEARAIRLALAGEAFPRPLTHDLFTTVVDQLGAKLVDVEVRALRDNTFLGTGVFATAHERRLSVDARPSDLIALALRADAPIFVDRVVFAEAEIRYADTEL